MKRVFSYGLILLAASAAGTLSALAAGGSAAEAMAGGGGVLFLLNGPGAAPAHAAQGYLGVDLRDVNEDQAALLKLKEVRGAEIILVDHDAPAGKAGLREHDVVVRMNGQAIDGVDQIRRMLHESPPGKTIVLIILRDGQPMTVTTQMATTREEVERQAWEQHLTVPEPQDLPASPSDNAGNGFAPGPASPTTSMRGGNSFIGSGRLTNSSTGAMLERMSSQLADFFGVPSNAGLLVRSVEANSPAALAGLHAGDVVVKANARTVTSTADWAKAIKDSRGHALTVVVLREKKEQTLILTPDGKRRSSVEQPTGDVVAHLGFSWMAQ